MKTLIITPAYNEEKFIKATIDSVVSQKLLPIEWVIVDDQSEDNTSNLVKEAASKYNWITYLRKEKKIILDPGNLLWMLFILVIIIKT